MIFSAWLSTSALLWPVSSLILGIIVTIETKKLVQFCRYGIHLAPHELQEGKLGYTRKMSCLIILALLGLKEIASGWNVSHLGVMISMVMIPLAGMMTYVKANYKLSLNQEVTSIYSTYIYPATLLIATTLKFTQELLWGLDWAGDLKFFILRLIILLVFIYEPMKPLEKKEKDKDNNKEKANDEDEEKEKQKPKGILSTIEKFYPLREYLVPTSTKGIVCGVLFLISTLLGSATSFYQDMYSMKIVDSLNLEVGNSSNTSSTGSNANTGGGILNQFGTVRLEFRWDFILIFYALKFFDSSILWVVKYYLEEQTQNESCSKLQLAMFSKLQNLSLRWHLENQSSEIFSMMTSSPYILQDIISTASWLIPETINMFVAMAYMLRYYNFSLSSVVILTGVLSCMIDFFVVRRQDRALEEMKEAESNTRTSRSSTFENYETMKYFTNEEYEKKKYEQAYFEEKDKAISEMVFSHVFQVAREFVRVGAEVLVILIVVKSVLGGDGLTAGDYLYFRSVFTSILWPVDSFIQFYKRLQENAIEVEKIAAVLNLEPEVTDDPDATDLEISKTGGSIEFRNVRFSYVPEREVIKDLTIFIPAGNTVAFVGRSGSGKSTLTKLLFRFYDTTSGDILVNGQPIKKVKSLSLRKAIGVVPQEVVLFSDTIKTNIQYAKMDATDEEIEEAAKAASLHDRITSFPEKYETEVGNRGLKLSGGEKQRVAIARAILRNPPIMVLDEATSSLDTETEKQIQGTLESLYENRTTIIIAHRLSTIVNVDTIFVLDEGSVVESGSHEGLLDKDGVYASMWNQQFSGSYTPRIASDCEIDD